MPLTFTSATRRAFDRMADDLSRVLGSRFVALVASSRTRSVAFATSLVARDLDALGALTASWRERGLDTPLLLTADELRRSLDVFPLRYQALLDRHIVIAGSPPFTGLVIHPVYLRQACEIEAKSQLIHLRQAWLEAGDDTAALGGVVAASAAPLRSLLANVARLHDVPSTGEDDAAIEGARLVGLDVGLVQAVLALEADPAQAPAVVARLSEYLAATESLWEFVDRWQRR